MVLFAKKNIEGGSIRNRRGKWNKNEQAIFVCRLGELLQSGYYLADALKFLQSQESVHRKQTIELAIKMLKEGHSLYEVLSFLGFNHQLLYFVYYAEYYGDLPKALLEGGRFWQKRNKDRDQLMKVLLYPIFLLIFIFIIFVLMQSMLFPKFQDLYVNMNISPTLFLKVILGISSFLHLFPYIMLTFLIFCYVIKKLWFDKLSPLKRKRYVLNIPYVGNYIRMFDSYFLTYQLSGLLAGGLSINDAILLFSKHSHWLFFHRIGEIIYQELNEGKNLEDIFSSLPYFDPYLSDVIANGQKNGKLDQELFHYSRIVLDTIENRMTSLIKMVQPVLFASVGLIVVSIYLSVLLPMFSIIENL